MAKKKKPVDEEEEELETEEEGEDEEGEDEEGEDEEEEEEEPAPRRKRPRNLSAEREAKAARTVKKKAPREERAPRQPIVLNPKLIAQFMVALVQAGAVDEISERAGERGRLAMRIRQMAQVLTRQAQKQGADDSSTEDEEE